MHSVCVVYVGVGVVAGMYVFACVNFCWLCGGVCDCGRQVYSHAT